MSHIDYEEGESNNLSRVTDTEKIRILVKVFPHLFIHYKVFAYLIAGEDTVEKDEEIKDVDRSKILDINNYYDEISKHENIIAKRKEEQSKYQKEFPHKKKKYKESDLKLQSQKILYDFYGSKLVSEIKRNVYRVSKRYYDASLAGKNIPNGKTVLSNIKKESFNVAKLYLSELSELDKKLENDRLLAKFKKIQNFSSTSEKLTLRDYQYHYNDFRKKANFNIDVHKKPLHSLIDKIMDSGTKVVNKWFKEDYRADIPNSDTKASIATYFNLDNEIWKPYTYTHEFEDKIQEMKNPDIVVESDKSQIQDFLIKEIEKLSELEQKKLDDIIMSQKIIDKMEIGNLKDYSSAFLFELAKYLKQKTHVESAIDILTIILERRTNYSYLYKGKILHLKAILLSTDTLKQWDDAIDILRDLFSFAEYHRKEPEILTLLASNYKRKAVYDKDGSLRKVEDVDTSLLMDALSYYQMAMKITEKKYYPAINIAYVERILKSIDTNSTAPLGGKHKIERLFYEVKSMWELNLNDWWEVSTQAEFYTLLGDDASALELYEAYKGTPTRFQIETTIRQLELYTHFCPQDDKAKGFMGMLRGSL